MLAVGLGRGHQGEQPGLVEARHRVDVGQRGPAGGDGAGLVQHDRVQPVRGFEGFGGADEDAGLGALAGADHDRQWGGQPQRARAGDDQHRDGGDQGEGQRGRRSGDEPGRERGHRDRDDGGHEVGGDRVGEPLDRRLGRLGLLHQPDDLGQHGVGADLGGAYPQRAGAVDGRPDHGVPGPFGDRHRLAGDHRLVHGGRAGQHHRVDRYLLAGAHDHLVADGHVLHRYLDLGAVAQHPGGARLQAEQRPDRLPGARLGPCLQQPAEQDQGQDDPDGLEVDLPHVGRDQAWDEGDQQAVPVGGAGAQRDQAVHVRAAVGQGQPAGAVDRPAGVEHHRCDQRELDPPVEQHPGYPAGTEHLVRHHREQHRHGQHRPDQHPPGQVSDLRAPLRGLRGLHLDGRRSGLASRRPGPSCGGTGRRRGAVDGRRRVGGLHHQPAVDHVHAAGEPELAGPRREHPHGGALVRR